MSITEGEKFYMEKECEGVQQHHIGKINGAPIPSPE